MKIVGQTDDGRQVFKKQVGGEQVELVETYAERDARLEAEAYELVRNTAPELLQACKGLLAIMPDLKAYLTVEGEPEDETGFTDDEQQAFDYALQIVRKLDPQYGVEQPRPTAPEVG